jgi:hypothetical protein
VQAIATRVSLLNILVDIFMLHVLLDAMRSHGAIVGFVTQASEAAAYPPFGIAWRTK